MSSTIAYIRAYLSRFLVIVGLLATLISWYFVSPEATAIANELTYWNMDIYTFTLFVGLLTIFARYLNGVRTRAKYWPYQLYAMILIIVWIIMGLSVGLYSDLYQTAYLSTKITLHIAILGQLVFFMVSAGYRVLRIKNFRTALFAICMVSVVVLNAPWLLSVFPAADKISYWLLNNPAMAGGRALLLAGGIGGVILGIRLLLGLEKGALRATE
ncbi:hypothetical protein KEJ47_09435 [Candidatus Bathyarchaeota archaeon]|nr:hypothetical protein [Candidatus Bathyarchaeota archaeon]